MYGTSISRDGKRLAFLRMRLHDGTRILDLRSPHLSLETSQQLGEDGWSKWSSVFTPDGSSIVYVSDPRQRSGIFRQDLRTKETFALVSGKGRYDDPAISPDGKWVLFSKKDSKDSPKQIMRMPMGGGSATVVLSGEIDVQCAVTANICVMVEQVKDGQELSIFDPVAGRGKRITQTKGLVESDRWSLSSDGANIAMLSDSAPSRIEILELQNGARSKVDLKDWGIQTAFWAPDNQHIYVSASVGDKFQIASVGLDGKVKNLISAVPGQAWMNDPRPSPDGRYLSFFCRRYESNAVMLENF